MYKSKKGFTLVECLIALAILSLVATAVVSFFNISSRSLFEGTQRLRINEDMRKLTSRLTQDARSANHFVVYADSTSASRDASEDRLSQGQGGEFLVLIYQSPWPTASSPVHITSLVGYFTQLSDEDNPAASLYRFSINYTPGNYKDATVHSIESLLPDEAELEAAPSLTGKIRMNENTRTFVNFEDRSVVVEGELIYGNAVQSANGSYSFTISPRG